MPGRGPVPSGAGPFAWCGWVQCYHWWYDQPMTDPDPKRATNIRFPEARHQKLVDLAWRRRMSVNALVNELVQDELDRETQPEGDTTMRCGTCDGSGAVQSSDGDHAVSCPTCGGSGTDD